MCWKGFGFVHHSRTRFCRAVPNPNLTVRDFFFAVSRGGSGGLTWVPALRQEACRGSAPTTRGYSCGLWLLLHSLASGTASPAGVAPGRLWMTGVRAFVGTFFTCTACRTHFMEMASTYARPSPTLTLDSTAAAAGSRGMSAGAAWQAHGQQGEQPARRGVVGVGHPQPSQRAVGAGGGSHQHRRPCVSQGAVAVRSRVPTVPFAFAGAHGPRFGRQARCVRGRLSWGGAWSENNCERFLRSAPSSVLRPPLRADRLPFPAKCQARNRGLGSSKGEDGHRINSGPNHQHQNQHR
jgi:hypothetical protein